MARAAAETLAERACLTGIFLKVVAAMQFRFSPYS
jgi:hypothetical protein